MGSQRKDEGMRSSFPKTEGSDPGRAVQPDDICELHPGCLPVGGPNSAGPLNRGFNPPNKRGEMVLLSISGHSLGSAHLCSDYLNAICSLARGERGHGQVIAADPDHTGGPSEGRPCGEDAAGCSPTAAASEASSSRLQGLPLHFW